MRRKIVKNLLQMKLNIRWVITIDSYYLQCCMKERFFHKRNSNCPQNQMLFMEASLNSLNVTKPHLNISFVLWYVTSGLKIEVSLSLFTKFCIWKWSLKLFCEQAGRPTIYGLLQKVFCLNTSEFFTYLLSRYILLTLYEALDFIWLMYSNKGLQEKNPF